MGGRGDEGGDGVALIKFIGGSDILVTVDPGPIFVSCLFMYFPTTF